MAGEFLVALAVVRAEREAAEPFRGLRRGAAAARGDLRFGGRPVAQLDRAGAHVCTAPPAVGGTRTTAGSRSEQSDRASPLGGDYPNEGDARADLGARIAGLRPAARSPRHAADAPRRSVRAAV